MKPQKRRTLFEHQTPWLIATLLGVVLSGMAVLAAAGGLLETPAPFRGHAPLNVALALAAVLLFTISGFYLPRKRMFQEEFSVLRASMQSWLWAHVYLALLATWLVTLHAGYSLLTAELTSGKLALLALWGSVLSGLVWRLAYTVIPRRAQRSVGNYSEAASAAEAERVAVEIEKLAAGRSAAFHEIKTRLLDSGISRDELQRARERIPASEQQALFDLAGLAERRRAALGRTLNQRRYLRWLQGWRILHVPLTVLFLALVPLHVVLAYELPAKLLRPGRVDGVAWGGFASSEECENCHAAIFEQWRGSLHARAMTRPTMIAQTNQDLKTTLKDTKGPDPKDLCINCHGPIGAALTKHSELPLVSESPLAATALLNEGISCVACHQFRGKSSPGQAALSSFIDGYARGRTYFGPRADAVGNSFHKSETSSAFMTPGELCQNCHSVNYDLNGDSKLEKGKDLVLQTVFEEWQYYRQQGGTASCVDCHMPLSGATRSAEAAWIPFEQDRDAPPRQVRDHSFIGADHRLDVPEAEDPHASARRRLLQSAASLSIEQASVTKSGSSLGFEVTVANVGTGHRLPSGFAFLRQLWLEVLVVDAVDRTLTGSGSIKGVQDDLCDVEMFEGHARSIREFAQGCESPDPMLVNFQSVLLDRVQPAATDSGSALVDRLGHAKLAPAPGAQEVFLQHFSGGPVPRVRGFDKQPVPALDPGEERSFRYQFELGTLSGEARQIKVRLLFRALAPYFLRALGNGQPPNEVPVAPLVNHLRIDELARATADIPANK